MTDSNKPSVPEAQFLVDKVDVAKAERYPVLGNHGLCFEVDGLCWEIRGYFPPEGTPAEEAEVEVYYRDEDGNLWDVDDDKRNDVIAVLIERVNDGSVTI